MVDLMTDPIAVQRLYRLIRAADPAEFATSWAHLQALALTDEWHDVTMVAAAALVRTVRTNLPGYDVDSSPEELRPAIERFVAAARAGVAADLGVDLDDWAATMLVFSALVGDLSTYDDATSAAVATEVQLLRYLLRPLTEEKVLAVLTSALRLARVWERDPPGRGRHPGGEPR
jgi:hypothetical protein